MKRVACFLMSLVLLCSVFPRTAWAASNTIKIGNVHELISFSQACAIENYSAGKVFELTADLDLTGSEFSPIPYFAGTFLGNNHKISGIEILHDGSRQGFFRRTSEGSSVYDLTVEGKVTPGGTGFYIGGIVGENNGKICNCQFSGNVAGIESVGGIAGHNTISGIVTGCAYNGEIQGEHQIGGIVGWNEGNITACTNDGLVNTVPVTPKERETDLFDLSSLDISSIAADDFLNLTDIGGVCGENTGVLSSCCNYGEVGYSNTAYNVGGIVGKTSGFVTDCENYGTVYGRKDVGGISGQLIPYSEFDLSQSKLRELRDEIYALQELIRTASADAASYSQEIKSVLDNMNVQAQDLLDLCQGMIDQGIHISGTVPVGIKAHLDANTLSQLVEKMSAAAVIDPETGIISINRDLWGSLETEITNILDLEGHISADAFQRLTDTFIHGASVDPETGKIVLSEEAKAELASALSVLTGVSGRVGLDDIQVLLPDTSTFMESLRSFLQSLDDLNEKMGDGSGTLFDDVDSINNQAENVVDTLFSTAEDLTDFSVNVTDLSKAEAYQRKRGAIAASRNCGTICCETNGGGIVGAIAFDIAFDMEDRLNTSDLLLSHGTELLFAAVRDCENSGELSINKNNAGGIAGLADTGIIINCTVTDGIFSSNGDYVGGIAGYSRGTIVNCRTRVALAGNIYVGGITGFGHDIEHCCSAAYIEDAVEYAGAVAGWCDGSVENCFYTLSNYAGIDNVSLTNECTPVSEEEFLAEEGIPESFTTVQVRFLCEGNEIKMFTLPFGGHLESLPEIANQDDMYWLWDIDKGVPIFRNTDVDGSYNDPIDVLSTEEDPPVFLAEGQFSPKHQLYVTSLDSVDDERLIQAVTITVDEYAGKLIVHMLTSENGELYSIAKDGTRELLDWQRSGKYIIFEIQNGDSILWCQKDKTGVITTVIIIIGILGLIALLVFLNWLRLRRTKKKRIAERDESTSKNQTSEEPIAEEPIA